MSIFKKIEFKDSLFSNILKVVMGTGLARIIGLVSIPILTRLYTPEDYGLLAVFVASIAILAPLLSLRYVTAIPLPKNDNIAFNLLFICIFLILFLGFFSGLILFLFAEKIFIWLNASLLSEWWWLIVLGSIAIALYEILNLWATRERAYSLIARTKVTQSFFGEVAKIILGLLSFKSFGLLVGNVIEQSLGVISFYLLLRKKINAYQLDIRKKYIFFLLKYYISFPLYRMPSQFLLVFSMQAPAIFSAAMYGSEITGQFSLALMAMALPISVIGASVGQVFYGEIASLGKKSSVKIKELVYKVQKKLFLLGIPIAIFIFIFGETIFRLVFGEKWEMAGNFASILAPYILLQLTSTPLIQVLNVYNYQLSFLVINFLRFLGLIGIYFLCSSNGIDEKTFVYVISGFLFSFYFFVTFYIISIVNNEAREN